ncbi:uncharacterized protein LOC132258449 [Phlebotomus argentipes]|uniref:uncharacterized protein LOC132258449 n=1 Tax=Phlebotomus argentipes TaxID=94469 RepID=UPI0028935B0C|nr:uncharacterized protein LOC132258449 [Phlebotomus argentipes]
MNVFLSDILPLFARINKDPTVIHIQKLNDLLERSNDGFAGKFYDKMLLTLLPQVDSEEIRKKPEVQRHLVATMEILLRKINVDNIKCFSTVQIVLLRQIYDFKSGSLAQTSEELKTGVLSCLRTLLSRTFKDVIAEFFELKNRKIIANLLFACVQIIEQEVFAGLKIEAINCILSFLQIHDEADFDDIVLRSQIADVIYTLLPRMLKCFMETAIGDSIKGHQLVGVSIKAIGRIICLILERTEMDFVEEPINLEDFKRMILAKDDARPENKDILKQPLAGDSEGKILRKDPEWIRAVSKKLKPYLAKLLVFTQHDHVSVRRELLAVCENFLKKCAENMLDCLQSLLEVIFVMSFDDDEDIAKQSCNTLASLKTHPKNNLLTKNAEATINSVLMTLPQSILREDDYKQVLGFSLLQSALEFISSNDLLALITDDLFLEKLTTVIILGAELNTKQEDLLAESGDKFSWRLKKYLTNHKCQRAFDKLCSALNKPEVIGIISGNFLRILEMRSSTSNQVLVIMNNLLSCEENQQSSWMMEFLLELLKDIHWNLCLQLSSEMPSEEILTREDIKFNVVHSCLVLESVGLCAKRMGSVFHPYLFKTFHRILAKAGSSNYCVRTAATMALEDMKESFNAATIEEFVHSNTDYIIFYVNKFLKKSYTYDDGLGMLQIILEYTAEDAITHFYLETILQSLLQDGEKIKDQQKLKAHFKIYHLFLLKMLKWSEENNKEIVNEESSDEILQQWLDILNQEEEIETEEHNETAPKEEIEETEKIVPNYVKLTDEMMRLVIKYISSKDQDLSLLSLELMTVGISVLSGCEEKLLPIVHLVWFPLSEKFKCNNPVILRQCFRLLLLLARTSKDFILKRTLSDVIPTINQCLIDGSVKSAKNSHYGMFIYTQDFKVISTILSQYGKLISDIQMQEKSLDTAIDCALLYMEKNQHTELQKMSLAFCNSLLNYDAPTIYLRLRKYPNFLDKLKIKRE